MDHHAHGEVIIVRWADDFVVGFEDEQDARRFLEELRERFARFGLELHPDKTSLIEFGRHAAWKRRRAGCGQTGDVRLPGLHAHLREEQERDGSGSGGSRLPSGCGRSWPRWKTEIKRRRHHPIPEQARWLASVLRGHYAYYGVPGNSDATQGFRFQVIGHWRRALRRRSQRDRMTWARMKLIADRWLPRRPRGYIPFRTQRLAART